MLRGGKWMDAHGLKIAPNKPLWDCIFAASHTYCWSRNTKECYSLACRCWRAKSPEKIVKNKMPLKIQLLIETTMAHHTLIAFDSLRLPKFSPNFLIKPKLARSWRQDRPVKDYRVMKTFGQEIVVKTKNLTFFHKLMLVWLWCKWWAHRCTHSQGNWT